MYRYKNGFYSNLSWVCASSRTGPATYVTEKLSVHANMQNWVNNLENFTSH